MCKAGGPRCKGSGGRRNTQASGGTAVAERPPEAPQPAKKSTVPTRDDADRLAAEHKAKHPDLTDFLTGDPLDDKTRRLYALRDSGWKGPIDQDGYPATTGDGAETLRYMARQRGENPDW